MKRTILLFAFLFCITTAFAQKLLKADRRYAALDYTEAAKLYEEYLEDAKKPKAEVVMKAADSYYYINNMGSALRWYSKLHELQGDKMDDRHFHRYILALRSEEKYEKADELMLKRLEMKGDAAMLERFNEQKKYLETLTEPIYAVSNLAVNSPKADFGAMYYGDKIVYASSRDTVGKKTYAWNDQPYLVLYEAKRDTATGAFSKDKKFVPKGQTTYHNAAATFTPDLKTVYFSVNNVKKGNKLVDDEKGTNNIQIVKGQISGDKLLKQEKLPFCSEEYSVGHPTLTADGKWMFFVSDMPGGLGETDIYYVEIYSDGTFGTPVNAGPEINTIGREMFPFVKDDALYFSSDGHYGLGGLDVFANSIDMEGQLMFYTSYNTGKPINSNGDDFAFIINEKETSGYLSSNRKGGKGDDDIYFFKKEKQKDCGYTISGTVRNKKDGKPLANVRVNGYAGDMEFSTTTGPNGEYGFDTSCGIKLHLKASLEGYSGDEKNIETGKTTGELKNVDFVLGKYEELVKIEDDVEKIDINPIYFDFDQYYVTPQGAAELDKVVYVMQHFPDIVIKIESHTDSRGEDDYNIRLSDDRAKSTFSYIIAKGIDPKRIESVRGYGETRLRNKCSNGVECTEEEHQLNRRSDFIIVRK